MLIGIFSKKFVRLILFIIVLPIFISIILLYYLSHKPVYVWDAVVKGNCAEVVLLITFNPDLTKTELSGNTNDELSYYGGLYRDGNAGMTLLHYAAYKNQEKIVQFLISKGMDVNARDQSGVMPLYYAIKAEHPQKAIVSSLISAGADVNVKFPHGETPLHSAMCFCERNPDIVKILVSHGANINVKDEDGNTPLSLAVKYGDADIANFLRNNGAKE